ncbi:Flagellum-specific peptidoglycan hydrolase FlgJ [Arenibacter nanhaiticus]|uniref:Peptidoglycan hydrolase n=1 Tax=Arenibacter nanhaiticus TaxID=558155 RepID=A0A1M6FFC7_9FLAO|nr:glucosaminidase domain-containing protein [Arenibacter nanhaiticus]SHI96411.1 Flagellum-specific peptidoglycan hydrolase FlgJ [Arenibacter nanhaiticus]
MIKRVVIVVLLGMFLSSCGAKRKAAHSKKPVRKSVVSKVDRERKVENKKADDGLYALPEDSGEFVKFSVNSVGEYIETFAEMAKFEMIAYGIPASITLAQGILESGAGKGALSAKTNNHFGIKCHTGWTGDYDHHDDDEKGECFRKYNHPMYSFRDHSIFLTTRARYASLFSLDHDDYKSWAHGLQKAGYATDKRYPEKLISIIERYQLDKYDREVLGKGPLAKRESRTTNHKIHIVEKGDTLYSISKRYFVSIPELMKLNNMKNSNLAIGQKLNVTSELK